MTGNGSAILRGSVMGTGATVVVRRHPESARLVAETFAWLRAVDATFSPFRPDSEISRLDRGVLSIGDCCPDVRHVLDECARLRRHTDGYFDAYATGRLDPSGYVKGWAIQVASQRLTAARAVNHLVDVGGDVQTPGPADARSPVAGRDPPSVAASGRVLGGDRYRPGRGDLGYL